MSGFDRADRDVDAAALERTLRRRVDGEVRFDNGSRALYSTDASNYRKVPLGVVVPHTVDAGAKAIEVCASYGAPMLSRGGGTSLGGQCCTTGVVIDWSKYCNRMLSIDVESRRCVVEPGIVLDELNRQLAAHGLQYGPRPATHAQCTLGGMIGNNSCGATAQAYGKVADNISRLEILTYDGLRTWVGTPSAKELKRLRRKHNREGEIYRGLVSIRDRYGDLVRSRYPDIPRRVSGYNLDALLPEHGFDVAELLVGSESTLVTVLHAEVDLVDRPEYTVLAVIGFSDVATAADRAAGLVRFGPHAVEGIDDKLVEYERLKQTNLRGIAMLPRGRAWLMVQFADDDPACARDKAQAAIASVPSATGAVCFDKPVFLRQMEEIREMALGTVAHAPGVPRAWPGWEDSAVPPERLGDYLRDLHKLTVAYGYGAPSVYGHFGHGCVHTRIPFDLQSPEGVATMRRFVEAAADLVVEYGGSFSGEHGDGQARSALLPKMFGDDLVDAMAELKTLFDPRNGMNPGNLVAPRGIDDDLRLRTAPAWRPATAFAYPHDAGRFDEAVNRCVGVGKCRSLTGGVMCPSYRATHEEKHSTRGRSRLLFEMVRGESPIDSGWQSPQVLDALDLCLACKGCKSDCPVNVDMATYKAEFLYHYYEHKMRPRAHYAMGWLPVWARAAAVAPRAVNAVAHAPLLARAVKAAGGVAPQREIPRFAAQRFTDWWQERGGLAPSRAPRGDVVLWPDTFTNSFDPSIGSAAVEVLEAAGFRVKVPTRSVCCGLTWISTGQLDRARRALRGTIDVLRDDLRAGVPVVGLEPSCTAVFRSDAAEFWPADRDVQRLRDQTRTLAEVLAERAPDWQPPLLESKVIVQRHCHQYAIMGFEADRLLLAKAGVDAEILDAGCCGLAGNFGFEKEHYAVSMACAEQALLPAVRAASAETAILADGFSCRTQIGQSRTGRHAVHLAQLLAQGLPGQLRS